MFIGHYGPHSSPVGRARGSALGAVRGRAVGRFLWAACRGQDKTHIMNFFGLSPSIFYMP
jgi:hypothetical protein